MEGWVARSGRGREGREDLGQLGGPTRGYVVIGVNGLGTRGACHATVRSARVLEWVAASNHRACGVRISASAGVCRLP